MEGLPTITEMYNSVNEKNLFGAIRKYEESKKNYNSTKKITKKGSYIDDEIKTKISPGPASTENFRIDKANFQKNWGKKVGIPPKYSERKTYIEEIQTLDKKKNLPSPNKYEITLPWPKKLNKQIHESQRLNFITTSEYESDKHPGPGSYELTRNILDTKMKKYQFNENKPRKVNEEKRPSLGTYDPLTEGTFQKLEKALKKTGQIPPQENKKKMNKENKLPGPGQYQIINTWKGKQSLKKNELCYMNKLHKGSTPNIYYN